MGGRAAGVCAVVVFLAMGCSDQRSDLPGGAQGEAQQEGAPPQKGFAYPQEALARMDTAPKITGTITVEGYTQGVLQIDVTLPTGDENGSPRGVPPITVFRQNTPGPYELFLPPDTKAVNLALILDLKGNGPDAEDPKLVYEHNPVEISGPVISGIDMVIDSHASALPPPEAAGQADAQGTSGQPATAPSPAVSPRPATRSAQQTGAPSPRPGQDALSVVKGLEETSAAGAESTGRQPSTTDHETAPIAGGEPSEPHGRETEAPATSPASTQEQHPPPRATPDPLDESLDTVPQ